MNAFSLKSEVRKKCTLLPFYLPLNGGDSYCRKARKIEITNIRKGEENSSLYRDDILIENPQKSTKQLLEVIVKFIKGIGLLLKYIKINCIFTYQKETIGKWEFKGFHLQYWQNQIGFNETCIFCHWKL